MDNQKTVGTFKLDGIIEGPMPPAESAPKIEAWLAAARQKGLSFSADQSTGQFSLMAENRVYKTQDFAQPGGLGEFLSQIFEQLLETYPMQMRMSLFSTLRSMEFRPGTEVQTVYAVAPPGSIQSQERVVEAKTVAPPVELSSKGKIKIAVIGLLVALVIGFVATKLFKPQIEDAAGNLTKLKVDNVDVQMAGFKDFITIEKVEIDKKKGGMTVKVIRGSRWDEAVNAKPGDVEDWEVALAAQCIRRGYVRCEVFDKDKKYIGTTELRIHDLMKEESAKGQESLVRLPYKTRPSVVRLTF